MDSASPSHEMADVAKHTAQNVGDHGSKLNTPPTSSAEIFSPENSSKRRQLRAASLSGSPSASRGFGSPSAGFGAGLQNVPSPITTTTIAQRQAPPRELAKLDDIREELPVTHLPGIAETLRDFAPSLANRPPMTLSGRPAPMAEDVSKVHLPEPRLLNRDSQEVDPKRNPSLSLNVYTRRADQIGPSHRIPGIGHLGDLLAPPGWKQGDEPINEAEAQRVFDVSRSQAKEMLDRTMIEISHLPSGDQEKRNAEINAQYQTRRILDEYLFIERVKLNKFWQERKQKHFQRLHSQPQQHRQFEPMPASRPQPLQPPAETSMMAYQRHQQSLVPASPHLYAASPPLTGGTLNARINHMQQSLHLPQVSPMSPTYLDPGLVPQTLEALYNCYARNQVIIMNMNNENERFLTQWSAKFHVPRSQNPIAPGVIPFITGSRAAPFGSIHYGYVQQEPRPWTPSQLRFEGIPDVTAQAQQARQTPLVSDQPNLRQGYGRPPSHPTDLDGPFRFPGGETDSPERRTQAAITPETKKRGRTPKTDKRKSWYADDVAKANLPTSVISQAAMKAGMDFTTNEDGKQTPPKPRSRRRMPIIDPKKGFRVSADAAKALIAKGAADARPRQGSVVSKDSTNESAAVAAPRTGVVAGYQAGIYPGTRTQVTHTPTLQRDEDTISAPNSAASGPGSDTPDDSKDTSYGQKAQRKPTTTRTTTAPRKATSTVGKKRKSTEAAAPAKKRTRCSVDGTADPEN